MVRCPLQEVDNMRALFAELFSDQSEFEIGFLARYTFITSRPMGQCKKDHLQKLLQSQQQFHRSIHYFIVYGVANLETIYETLDIGEDEKSQQSNQAEMSQGNQQISENAHTMEDEVSVQSQAPDVEMSSAQNDPPSVNSTHLPHLSQTEHETQVEPTPPSLSANTPQQHTGSTSTLSVRMFLYMLDSHQTNGPLFQAVYPSIEKHKIYVLCTEPNMEEALKTLHNLPVILANVFEDDVIEKVPVGHNGRPTYVKDYPVPTAKSASYAQSLISLIPEVNPQEQEIIEIVDTQPRVSQNRSYAQATAYASTHSSKRTRQGEQIITPSPKQGPPQSLLPKNFSDTTSHHQLQANVNENIARMKNIEQHQSKVNQTLTVYGGDISQISKAVSNNSEAIHSLREAQMLQTKTMEAMQKTQEKMLVTVDGTAKFIETYVKSLVEPPDGNRGAQS